MGKFSTFIAFVVGATVGSVATYFISKDIFEKEKDNFYEQEVKPARDEYYKKTKELAEKNRSLKEKMVDTYEDLNKQLGYVKEEAKEKVEEIKESVKETADSLASDTSNFIDDMKERLVFKKPDSKYFISADDYAEREAYQKVSLTYHANGIVIDSAYNPIDDPEDILGEDNYKQLSKLLEDRVEIAWIRNDDIFADYEIQLVDYDFND